MTQSGHNVLGGSSADQLRGCVRRIEKLDDEIKDLNHEKREVYREVHACGFDKRVVRQLITRRKWEADEREEADALLALYEKILLTGSSVSPLDN